MTKTYVKYIVFAAILVLAAYVSFLSFAACGNLVSVKQRAMLCLEQPLSNQEAETIRQEIEKGWEESRQDASAGGQEGAGQEGSLADLTPEFCIWGQKEEVLLGNQDLERSIQTDAILLCGNPELVFEDCRRLDRDDLEGCLVDEAAAWELFGDLDVEGERITCEGKDFVIRGVVPGNRKLFAHMVDGSHPTPQTEAGAEAGPQEPAQENSLDRITLQRPEGKSIQELYSEWSNRYSMYAKLMDLELLQGISGCCMLLMPTTLCICLLWYLCRRFRKVEQLWQKAGIAGLILLVSIGFGFFLKHQVRIPDEYIPTRWSDFSFWSRLWEEKREAVQLLLQMPKADVDYGWMAGLMRMAGFGILSEALLLPALLMARQAVSCKKRKVRDIP